MLCRLVGMMSLKVDGVYRKSLDLVELLLRLSEAGHYQPVSELFKFPVQHCADMLVLSLLQIVSISTFWETRLGE